MRYEVPNELKKGILTGIIILFFISLISASFGYDNPSLPSLSQELFGDKPSGFYMPNNQSVFGNYSFNGGWQGGGLSIIDGDIYAQTGYFYNITSLNVTRQNLTVLTELIVDGNVIAGDFIGDGSLLTNLNVNEIDLSAFVPYAGADSDVDIGANDFYASNGNFEFDLNVEGNGNQDILMSTSSSGSYSRLRASSVGGYDLSLIQHSTTYGGSLYGYLRSNLTVIDSDTPNGLGAFVIGTSNINNLTFITDSEPRLNISGEGNAFFQYNVSADYFIGDGSLLTNISGTDPTWTANYTAYNDTWSSMTNTSYYLKTNPFGFLNDSSLTDNSMVDTLHRHSELSASDGTPDQSVVVDANGYLGIDLRMLHNGDPDTYFQFITDRYQLVVGGHEVFDYIETGLSTLKINNDDQADISFHTTDLFIGGSQGSYDGKVGIGTTSPSHKLNVFGDVNITGIIINDAIYCESSELIDQNFPTAGLRQRLNISNVDEGNGITMSTGHNGTNITIDTSGVYHLVAQPQVKAGAGGAGDFHMWIEKHNTTRWVDISDSNIELKLSSLEEDVIVLATTLKLNQGEKLRLVASVSDNKILLHAQSPAGEPVIPSIIFTMYRIGS